MYAKYKPDSGWQGMGEQGSVTNEYGVSQNEKSSGGKQWQWLHNVNVLNAPELCTEKWFRSVQSLSRVQLIANPQTVPRRASLSITRSQSLLKLMSIESVMPSNHLILCCPLLLLPSIFPRIRGFSSKSVLCIRWPKYWSFSISPSSEYSGLISFRIDWLDLLGTLKNLLQHHSSKASILFTQLSLQSSSHIHTHDYWKNHSFGQMDLCWQSNASAF